MTTEPAVYEAVTVDGVQVRIAVDSDAGWLWTCQPGSRGTWSKPLTLTRVDQ